MLILALVLAMRALVPQGLMAAPDGAGQMAVLLCDGSGPAERHLVPLGGKHGHDQAASPCAFAALADAADHGDDPVPTIADRVDRSRRVSLVRPALAPGATEHLRPPSQGPPLAA